MNNEEKIAAYQDQIEKAQKIAKYAETIKEFYHDIFDLTFAKYYSDYEVQNNLVEVEKFFNCIMVADAFMANAGATIGTYSDMIINSMNNKIELLKKDKTNN